MTDDPSYDGTSWDRVVTEADRTAKEASAYLHAALTRLRRIQHSYESVDAHMPEHLRLALEEVESAYGWMHDEAAARHLDRLAREDAARDAAIEEAAA